MRVQMTQTHLSGYIQVILEHNLNGKQHVFGHENAHGCLFEQPQGGTLSY